MNVIKTAALGATGLLTIAGSVLLLAATAGGVRWAATGVETFHEPVLLGGIGLMVAAMGVMGMEIVANEL